MTNDRLSAQNYLIKLATFRVAFHPSSGQNLRFGLQKLIVYSDISDPLHLF
jgi:hypothetical protein